MERCFERKGVESDRYYATLPTIYHGAQDKDSTTYAHRDAFFRHAEDPVFPADGGRHLPDQRVRHPGPLPQEIGVHGARVAATHGVAERMKGGCPSGESSKRKIIEEKLESLLAIVGASAPRAKTIARAPGTPSRVR